MEYVSPPLEAHQSNEMKLKSELEAAGWSHPYGAPVSEPCFLVDGSLELPSLRMLTGTLLVTGDLVLGELDVQRCGRQLANLIVFGTCRIGTGYLDGFLAVRKDLVVGTFVGDTTWDGGLWVGGAVDGDTLVLDDMGFDCDGETRVKVLADLSETPEARTVYGAASSARAFFSAARKPA